MNIAIIPARGGSKRIPRKNIQPFCGKPLIAYSIEAALTSGVFQQVIVSTDDDEIAAIAQRLGAEVPFIRPGNLADDYAVTVDVIAHAIAQLSMSTHVPEYVCCIYATAPFIQADDICRALEQIKSSNVEYVFPSKTFPYPIFPSLPKSKTG